MKDRGPYLLKTDKSGTTNAVPQRVRALCVRCAECAKALMAIAQTAAVLDSSGRREREPRKRE